MRTTTTFAAILGISATLATSWAGDLQSAGVQGFYTCLRSAGLSTLTQGDGSLQELIAIPASREGKSGLYLLDQKTISFYAFPGKVPTRSPLHKDMRIQLPSEIGAPSRAVYLNFDRDRDGSEQVALHLYPAYEGSHAESVGGPSLGGVMKDTMARLTYEKVDGGPVPDSQAFEALNKKASSDLHYLMLSYANDEIQSALGAKGSFDENFYGNARRLGAIRKQESELKQAQDALTSLRAELSIKAKELFRERMKRDLIKNAESQPEGDLDGDSRRRLRMLQSKIRSAKLRIAAMKLNRAELESRTERLQSELASQKLSLAQRTLGITHAMESVKAHRQEVLASCAKVPNLALQAQIESYGREIESKRPKGYAGSQLVQDLTSTSVAQ